MVIPCKFPEEDYDKKCLTAPAALPHGHLGADDVVCTVGPDGDTWTMCARRDLLKKVPMLHQLTNDGQPNIRLTNVDKRGFEQFVRSLDSSTSAFTSVATARTTLDVAHHFQYIPTLEYCVHYLDHHLASDTVLCVYQHLSRYCNNAHTHAPSAPAYHTVPLTASQLRIQEICSYLMHNCLLMIDAEAKRVLAQELVEELSGAELLTIVSRDTLQIKNETLVYEAVMRWARCQAMKLHVPLTHGSLRDLLLQDLLYKVRYVLMSKKEFLAGPAAAGILDQNEVNQILAALDRPKVAITGLLVDANKPRGKQPAKPLFLSLRTKLVSPKRNVKPKLEKKDKFLLTCLSVFVAIFD